MGKKRSSTVAFLRKFALFSNVFTKSIDPHANRGRPYFGSISLTCSEWWINKWRGLAPRRRSHVHRIRFINQPIKLIVSNYKMATGPDRYRNFFDNNSMGIVWVCVRLRFGGVRIKTVLDFVVRLRQTCEFDLHFFFVWSFRFYLCIFCVEIRIIFGVTEIE